MYTIQYPNIKKFILLSVSVSSLFLASCNGGDDSNNLEALKQKQAELKTELANLATQISKLEGDSANQFVLVDAAPITPQFFKTYINVQGRVDADENVALSAEMPGTIIKINVKAGDEVRKGQELAETDSRAVQQSLSAVQTSLI
ncbi:MAG: biotin/lipoyl-binding protein [Sphingobacteriaceae bacterium]|nr:biotin/lipoyl-binding protein [Sphingobacteriaceae bacterium]